jgi:hypothetical protein
MCGIINGLIKDWLLTEKAGVAAYISSFRACVLPTGWPRFQNPITHHKSYGFAEKFRLSLMLPFIFVEFLEMKHCRAECVSRIKNEFQAELLAGQQFKDIVVRLLVLSAINSYLVAKPSLTVAEQPQLAENMLQFRKYLQRFVKLTGTLKDEAAGDKMTKRPNMHQAMHVAKYLNDYATMKNCDVSLGETKHRQLKDKAQHANKINVDKQIMLDVARKEAIRIVANGDRADTHPEISQSFKALRDLCPSLFAKMIPWNLEEFEIDEQEQSLVGHGIGQTFANLAVSRSIPAWQAKFPVTLLNGTYFYRELKAAYERDYRIRLDDVRFNPRVQYRSRAFTVVRKTEKKLVFQCGRWIKIPDSYGQIGAVFSHTRLDETRVFLVLHQATLTRHDALLDCDVYELATSPRSVLSQSYRIVGLPAISEPELFHFIQMRNQTQSTRTARGMEKLEYWHNHRVQKFL